MDNTASNISKEHNPYETILKQNEILSERVMYLEADRDRLQKELDDVWLSFAMAASRQDVGGAQEEYEECCDRWKKERE